MALDKRVVAGASCGIMCIACVLFIVSNAVPQWSVGSLGGIESKLGLWRICVSTGFGSGCSEISCLTGSGSVCDKMLVARTFITMACCFSGLSAVLLILVVVISTLTKPFIMGVKAITIVSFVVGVIGLAVGIAYATNSGLLKVSAAAIVAIVATVVNLAGAVVALLIP